MAAPRIIVLDSTPLALLVQRRDLLQAEYCRAWARDHLAAGDRIVVPAIIEYETRRELLRMNKTASLSKLDRFLAADPNRCLQITPGALRLASELWARARKQGLPTADPHALDIDVILAAQVLESPLAAEDYVTATSNLGHLTQFVKAALWDSI